MWITSSVKAAKTPTHIALGNFDGVHLGHQHVMAQILGKTDGQIVSSGLTLAGDHLTEQNGEQSASSHKSSGHQRSSFINAQSIAAFHNDAIASGYSERQSNQAQGDSASVSPDRTDSNQPDRDAYPTVVTFFPHPQEYFSKLARPLLTPIQEKTWLLAHLGIRQLVMLPFNQALANLSPEVFVKQILIDGLQAQRISVGDDFRFGKGRSGTAEGLAQIAARYGVPVTRAALKQEKGDRISSSRIRQALATGELTEATQLLGRPYMLTGKVVRGQQIGRTIGFATANLQLPADKYLPRTGVYGVRAYGASKKSANDSQTREIFLPGVMNIGHRPTVGGQSLSVEVHLLNWSGLNWSGDLYGQTLTVSLETFIRPEQKFDSLTQLKEQIEADCNTARRSLAKA